LQHRLPTVPLEFQDILAGIGRRPRKVQGEALIQRLSLRIQKAAERCDPWFQMPAPEKRRKQVVQRGAREPNDADGSRGCAGGYRYDKITLLHARSSRARWFE